MSSDPAGPLVSALIPTYRRPKLLERAVRSVLGQTHRNVRACIFDNASGDETGPSMKRLAAEDPRIDYRCHASNMGAGPNFNFSLGAVDTPYFSFLSDDDVLLPKFYETALDAFRKFPRAGFVVLDVLILSSWGDLKASDALHGREERLYEPEEGVLEIVVPVPPTWTSIVFRTDLLRQLGLLNLDAGAGLDIDFIVRAATAAPFAVRHVPGAIFTHDSIALTRMLRGVTEGFWPGWRIMIDRLCGGSRLPEGVNRDLRARLTKLLVHNLTAICTSAVIRGDFQDARDGARVLRAELGQTLKGASLSTLAWAARYIPLVRRSIVGLFNARVKMRHARLKALPDYQEFYPLIEK